MVGRSFINFFNEVSVGGRSVRSVFEPLHMLADEIVGAKLFTVTICAEADFSFRRIFSSLPDVYPTNSTKPANQSAWSECVMVHRRTFVANTIAQIAEVFADHKLIQSLGCESVINIPVDLNGQVIGIVNCLHEAGYYTGSRIEAAEVLKLPAALCLLLFHNGKIEEC